MCIRDRGCYRELMPTLEYVKQEQKQEKPSIRDQLRTAAKQQPCLLYTSFEARCRTSLPIPSVWLFSCMEDNCLWQKTKQRFM